VGRYMASGFGDMFKYIKIITIVWICSWLLYEFARTTFKDQKPEFTIVDFNQKINKKIDVFRIHKKYHPTYTGRYLTFSFYISPEDLAFHFKKLGAVNESLSISVNIDVESNKMRSVNSFKRISERTDQYKYLMDVDYNFKKYSYEYGSKTKTVASYFIKKDENGYAIVINDPGNWSVGRRVYRRVNEIIELDYVMTKDIKIEDWDILDKFIINKINSFKMPYNKSLKQDK
jgi:hypothetical protein